MEAPNSNRANYRWKKRSTRSTTSLVPISLLLLLFSLLFFLSYNHISSSLIPVYKTSQRVHSHRNRGALSGEKFLWYAPHSGFSNQLSEFKNAVLISVILNRTLIVPPVLDHHAVALGSCPKFRVLSPEELRLAVWNHMIELIHSRRYVSMADVIDLSNVVSNSDIRVIDFRVFVSIWCDVKIDSLCTQDLNIQPLSETLKQCGAILSGYNGTIENCLYAVNDDCRTTVWTYGDDNEDGKLDPFQPDEKLKKKKKMSFVRKRFNVYKAFGPGSKAESTFVLAFGSLFTAPYKGSELYIDIQRDHRDERIKTLLEKVEFLSFVPEIVSAGKEFASKTIKSPFLCAQLRLLDGQFKNHQKTTFMGLKQRIDSLIEKGCHPIHIFVMTDLPRSNWTGTYLQDLANDPDSFKLHILRDKDELVTRTVTELVEVAHGMRLGFIPENLDRMKMLCHLPLSPDILLYIEESVCSCASLGFVGTTGSTIAEGIQWMRRNGVCSGHHPSVL